MSFQQQLAITFVSTICPLLVGYFYNEYKHKQENDDLYQETIRVVLHELIMTKCEKLLNQDYITTEEYEDLLALNKPYMRAKGNGTAKLQIQLVTEKYKRQRG